MRWLTVLPFERPERRGMDFKDELLAAGHEVSIDVQAHLNDEAAINATGEQKKVLLENAKKLFKLSL